MIVSIYGEEYDSFWAEFDKTYKDSPEVWYEVRLDFFEDVYDDSLSLEQNLHAADEYIKRHKDDY